ncbi:MAG: hypothetical protein KIT83_04925 [Bryobacterales bacterium]|nr:hypothetical protein [Bryobacterales bacterium]
MFAAAHKDGVFRQGEILSDVVQLHIRADSLVNSTNELDFEEKIHPFALVLTQDCDLDWDFKARAADPHQDTVQENKRQAKLVPNVLLCELMTADVLRPRLAGGDVLKRIRNNQDERYHCFPAAEIQQDSANEGLPELVADFKRVFSLPTDELYARLAMGLKRRVVIMPPYLQHLSTRFGYYCLRVALPELSPLGIAPAPSQALLAGPNDGSPASI